MLWGVNHFGKINFRGSSRVVSAMERRNIWEGDCHHHVKCTAPNQLVTFMEK